MGSLASCLIVKPMKSVLFFIPVSRYRASGIWVPSVESEVSYGPSDLVCEDGPYAFSVDEDLGDVVEPSCGVFVF